MIKLIAGVDEVGRGSLAGPVIASAVILKQEIFGLNDSKKLSKKKREILNQEIITNSYFSYGSASVEEIDDINILQASLLAMKRAILNLPIKPHRVLVDGAQKPDIDISVEAIVGGDSLIAEISAASIIAKVYRDDLMMKQDIIYPNYGFRQHKGYGTKMHIENIRSYGNCPIHRKTFKGTS